MFAKLGNCCHDIFELALRGAFCSIFLPSLIKNYVNCFLFFLHLFCATLFSFHKNVYSVKKLQKAKKSFLLGFLHKKQQQHLKVSFCVVVVANFLLRCSKSIGRLSVVLTHLPAILLLFWFRFEMLIKNKKIWLL